jgi:DNA-binding MarR family transcriptional regulator
MSKDYLRRRLLNRLTPEERNLFDCLQEIEKLPASPILTEAVIHLQNAREKLADWVDKELEMGHPGSMYWKNLEGQWIINPKP